MRDLDSRGVMNNDFIVVYGDVVSNLPLDAALAEHRERRAKDKNAIMTMVLREAGTWHRTKARGLSPVFVVDPVKQRCLHYEQMSVAQEGHHVELNDDTLSSAKEVEIRADLIDCGIDICTPDVLALWSDNFDYEAPRRGFLHSVLKDYELNGKTIHTHIVNHHYAARVRNLHAYGAISKDIVSRWAHPISPDSNLLDGQSYKLCRGNIFQEDGVSLARSCKIGRGTMLGSGTRVLAGSRVFNSIIGRNCTIGKNCVIEDAFIWDGATIGDETRVTRAIVGSDSSIGAHCDLLENSLISYKVFIPDNTTIQAGKKLLRTGEDGKGSEDYDISDSEDEDDGAGLAAEIYRNHAASITAESISTIHSDLTDDDEEVEPRHTSSGSFISVASDESHADRAGESFVQDAATSVYDSLHRGHDVSTIQLELQGLRMSANASEHQVRRAVVNGLIKHLVEARKLGTAAKQTLQNNKMLIERTMFDKDTDEKPDQVDFLLLAQTELSKKAEGDAVLLSLCNDMYMLDLIEQEGLEQWWDSERSTNSEEMRLVRGKAAAFMTALAEAVSESEDEDEDSE